MKMTTSRTNTAKITAPTSGVELGDLRWLLQQLEGAPDTDRVRVTVNQGFDQRDPGEIIMTADVPDRQMRPNPIMPPHPPGARSFLASRDTGRPIADSPQA